MKKINAITWLITMLMTLVASPTFATDWGSENVTMQVGETKTLYLPSSVTSKTLKSVNFYSASWNDVEVVSHTNYSVKVKALKATSTPVIVRCDYYYYINNGGYTYQNGGAYDFKVTVEGETTVKPTKITIPSVVSVEVGESKDIEATVTPANAEYTLTWSISDNSIATVYQNGMITGKSVGYADLKVKADNGVYAMCRVSVYRPTPSSVSMKSSLAMNVGDTYTLSPTVYPSNSQYTLTWTSSNTNVATVSSSGKVTAKSPGTTNVTVKTDNDKTATCNVTVSAKSVTSVSVKSTLSMEVGDTYTLTPTVTPSDAETSFTWSSDKSNVATVSQYGVVTAKSVGTANITVKTDNGKTATCKVTVSAKSVTSVSVKSTLSMEVGDTYTLTPTVTPSDAETSFTWSSDKSSVATVSQYGVVTAKGTGTANITVKTDNGKTATCKVTVSAKSVTSVSVKSTLSMEVGDTYTLTPTVTPSDAETSFTWSSDKSSVATVSQYGVVTAKGTGTANITVKTDNGKTATCKVTVTAQTVTEYEVGFSIYGYEYGQVLYNGSKLAGETGSGYGSFKVAEGSNVALTILPNEGYKIEWVWLDWEDVADQLVNNVLTIQNIRANTHLVVSFEKDEQPVVIVPVYLHCNVGEGGYITSGNTTIMGENKIGVGEGDDIAIKIVANKGYHIETVKLDGVEMKSQLFGNELTIKNMTQDKNLVVRFEKDENQQDEPVVTTENAIVLGNVTANTGTTVAFPVSLTNKDEITALQMDLHLPSGITMATDADGDVMIETSSRVSNKHTIDCSKMADGTYRIICYSTKNNTFTGNSGILFNLMLNIDANANDGDYVVSATGIELSDNTGTAYTGKDAKGTVTVKSYMIGDVDGNGQYSINDVVCIINHVLNRPNTTFVEAAADLDGNDEISVNDAVLLIKTYILGQQSNARQATRTAAANGENYISIEDVKMQPGEIKTIEVMMTNEHDDIRGMQCDITLPAGISFLYDEDDEDYVTASSRIPKKLALSSEMQNENTLRVAGVCTGSSSIYGNSGTIFTFRVKANENIMVGKYQIQLSNAELSYGEAIGVADRSSVLEILGDANGISTLFSNGVSNIDVYDLNGRRVDESKTRKGIFIINGKKVLVK
jgi:uncharacterized protein YjdB